MLRIEEIIKLHNPIFNKLNIINDRIFIIPPYNVPFIASLDNPIPVRVLVSGACI